MYSQQVDYGVLSVLNGKLNKTTASALSQVLDDQARRTKLSQAELLLIWAYDRLHGLVVSSSSQPDRVSRMATLFLGEGDECLPAEVYEEIEKAAAADGYEGKLFYKHAHMEAAAAAT